jgi:hypothetical protein
MKLYNTDTQGELICENISTMQYCFHNAETLKYHGLLFASLQYQNHIKSNLV